MRFRRRIGARDRLFLALFVVLALVATGVTLLLRDRLAQPAVGSRCITVVRASFMGGASFKYCGTDAVAFCRRSAATAHDVAMQCRRLEASPR
jgi:hypothetical protein